MDSETDMTDGLGSCEVTLTISLADAASPEEVARRFLAVVRDAPGRTDLHLTVTPADTGKPIDVLVTAGQQAADVAER